MSAPDGGYLLLYRRPGALPSFARTKALFVAAGLARRDKRDAAALHTRATDATGDKSASHVFAHTYQEAQSACR